MNRKRVQRVYRDAGLSVRRRWRKRVAVERVPGTSADRSALGRIQPVPRVTGERAPEDRAYSGQSGQAIRFNPARHSGPKRPPVPAHFGHVKRRVLV